MPTSNFKNEKPPRKKIVLPEGWREFALLSCKESTSKQGNPMVIVCFKDVLTGNEEDVYFVTVEGKQWFFKTLLEACGITEDKEGNVEWDIHNIIGKSIWGLVKHEPNTWINRRGETIHDVQHKIIEVSKELVAWDESVETQDA